jgi:hypothetical protein
MREKKQDFTVDGRSSSSQYMNQNILTNAAGNRMDNPVERQVTKSPETQAGCGDIQEARIRKGQLTIWREHASTEPEVL